MHRSNQQLPHLIGLNLLVLNQLIIIPAVPFLHLGKNRGRNITTDKNSKTKFVEVKEREEEWRFARLVSVV